MSTATLKVFVPSGSRLVVAAFFTALWLVFVGTWLGWGQFNSSDENRTFSVLPRHLDAAFPGGLKLYLHDHFGFRGWLVTLNAYLRAHMFRTSTSPRVVIGKQGFLFYADEGVLENYIGTTPMTDCEVESWVQLFERRAAWLALHKIPLVVTIAPDKHTIYPEMLPDGIPRSSAPSRTDRFIEALRSRTNLTIVDLRPALKEAKQGRRSYYLTDTHWSQWGAYAAYREVLRAVNKTAPQLAPRIGEPLDPAILRIGAIVQTGDLNRILGLGSIAPETKELVHLPNAPPAILSVEEAFYELGTSNPAQPRLVMMLDSFGSFLLPYLNGHFSRIYALRTWLLDPMTVTREHPDVVVIEMVERRLNEAPPPDPELAMPLPSDAVQDPRVWGVVDEPFQGADLSGPDVKVSGWALALQPNSIHKVEIMLDGKVVGEPNIHLPRPDVDKVQPGMRDSPIAGLKGTMDTRRFPNGRHRFSLKLTDSTGRTGEIGRRQFCIAN